MIYYHCGAQQQVSCWCFDQVARDKKGIPPQESARIHTACMPVYANLSNLAVSARTRGFKLLFRSLQRQLHHSAVHT